MSNNYLVQPGTMLYDVDGQMIGWVVGRHQWPTPRKYNDSWDIQWSSGKQEYWDEESLQYFIKAYIMLEEDNDKR